jgi:hypothetical protein
MSKISKIFLIGITLFLFPVFALADYYPGQVSNFYVDSSYDATNRIELKAALLKSSQKLYFYVDNNWLDSLSSQDQQELANSLSVLGDEFYLKIYPVLTSNFGAEWNPGIDNDEHITVLLEPMKKEARGYFRNIDEYSKLQSPYSNEREMIYLNANYVTSTLAKNFLAHELVHLISFNQKEKGYGVNEETWLNEARAEYASMLVGYDSDYQNSYLAERVKVFLENPSDSLTEWKGNPADYGALNLFTHYLVEKYGIKILTDSLHSKEVGIKSLNEALIKNGFKNDFAKIFTDWTIAMFVNDCTLGEKYCYFNKNLEFIRVMPSINFLPIAIQSNLMVNQSTKDWSGNWFKFIGGKGILKVDFIGKSDKIFKIPYLLKDISGKYILNFLQLDNNQRGEILIPGFLTEISSITLIPSIQSKTFGFSSSEVASPFSWSVSLVNGEELKEKPVSNYLDKPITSMTKEELSNKIAELTGLMEQLKNQLAILETNKQAENNTSTNFACGKFQNNLFYGLTNNSQVRCLQEFLSIKEKEIYPEGLITGNFLDLTRAAIVRFQEKNSADILTPLGLKQGTGFFGNLTREKVNKIMGL